MTAGSINRNRDEVHYSTVMVHSLPGIEAQSSRVTLVIDVYRYALLSRKFASMSISASAANLLRCCHCCRAFHIELLLLPGSRLAKLDRWSGGAKHSSQAQHAAAKLTYTSRDCEVGRKTPCMVVHASIAMDCRDDRTWHCRMAGHSRRSNIRVKDFQIDSCM